MSHDKRVKICSEQPKNEENMKKLIMMVLAATAFSCGDGNRSSERNDMDDNDNTEIAEPADSTDSDDGAKDSRIEGDGESDVDTASTWDRHRDNLDTSDSLNNKQ
jgi:hypothetical protein